MPTYVYHCESCDSNFEKMQKFSDDPLTSCECGAEGTVRRVLQPVGIVFKGSGWYITDSRNSTTATTAAGKSDSTSKDDTSSKASDSSTSTSDSSTSTSDSSSKASDSSTSADKSAA